MLKLKHRQTSVASDTLTNLYGHVQRHTIRYDTALLSFCGHYALLQKTAYRLNIQYTKTHPPKRHKTTIRTDIQYTVSGLDII